MLGEGWYNRRKRRGGGLFWGVRAGLSSEGVPRFIRMEERKNSIKTLHSSITQSGHLTTWRVTNHISNQTVFNSCILSLITGFSLSMKKWMLGKCNIKQRQHVIFLCKLCKDTPRVNEIFDDKLFSTQLKFKSFTNEPADEFNCYKLLHFSPAPIVLSIFLHLSQIFRKAR